MVNMETETEQWPRPDWEAVIRNHPLLPYCRERGWKMQRAGREWKCLCPLHNEDTPSFFVNPDTNEWFCHGSCRKGGHVIHLHAELEGIPEMEAACNLAGVEYHGGNGQKGKSRPVSQGKSKANPSPSLGSHSENGPQKPSSGANDTEGGLGEEVAVYDYQDATGAVVFQVVRYEPKNKPKTFRQRHIASDGRMVWNIDGVERVPYRLPELLGYPLSVWIVEGEKDVETLRAVNQTATCNPGGANKWLPAHSQYLRGKCVYLVPDNDEPGQKHARAVLASLAGVVEWVRWVALPPELGGKPVKDISDLREACGSDEAFSEQLEKLQDTSRLIERGVESRLASRLEIQERYRAGICRIEEESLALGSWLPGLGVAPLQPGDLLGVLGSTGSLKTSAVINIVARNPSVPMLLFEAELAERLLYDRMAAMTFNIAPEHVCERERGAPLDWNSQEQFRHFLACDQPLTMKEVDEEIARSSAKLGRAPRVFILDYAQLIPGPGSSRYERVSDTCEEARRLAKKWRMIGVIVSQVSRPEKGGGSGNCAPNLYDAKESGSFENSCSLVIGLRKLDEPNTMEAKVLKNSQGGTGNTIRMNVRLGCIIEPEEASQWG
jgi:hypothetical protein